MSGLPGLVERLHKRGYLPSPSARDAFLDVELEAFILPSHRLLAYEDTPVPYHENGPVGLVLSRRLTAVLLQLAPFESEEDIFLYGSDGGYLAALLSETVPDAPLVVIEENEALARATRGNLGRAGYGSGVGVETKFPKARARWICQLRPGGVFGDALQERLMDLGTLLYPRQGARGHELVQVVRNGDEFAELAIRETSLKGPQDDGTPAVNVASLLALEEFLGNVWTGENRPTDAYLRELVESTFEGGPWEESRQGEEDARRFERAKTVFRLAHIHQILGDLENAERLYRRSLEIHPTAEGHTFLGWTYSFLDRLEDAMRECRRAIDVDPSLGNPYNDMGAYLIQLNRLDEAVPWLKRATRAARYCCPFYAYCNLGRVYMLKGDLSAARNQFARALEVNPEYDLARQLLDEVEKLL